VQESLGPAGTTTATRIRVCHLGADVLAPTEEDPGSTGVRTEIRENFSSGKFYMMVGTIEPRKGYDTAYDAFCSLWDAGEAPGLVVIGRSGWECDGLLERMKNDARLGKRLWIYHDANDNELVFLYRHAQALIFASRIEGFGLPLVEAMQHGLAVIASDIPVFREIADGYANFFATGDSSDLARLVRLQQREGLPQSTARQWRTWDVFAAQLVDSCVEIRGLAVADGRT
jgi:alpha-1,2-rhamnosyltransferase